MIVHQGAVFEMDGDLALLGKDGKYLQGEGASKEASSRDQCITR